MDGMLPNDRRSLGTTHTRSPQESGQQIWSSGRQVALGVELNPLDGVSAVAQPHDFAFGGGTGHLERPAAMRRIDNQRVVPRPPGNREGSPRNTPAPRL